MIKSKGIHTAFFLSIYVRNFIFPRDSNNLQTSDKRPLVKRLNVHLLSIGIHLAMTLKTGRGTR